MYVIIIHRTLLNSIPIAWWQLLYFSKNLSFAVLISPIACVLDVEQARYGDINHSSLTDFIEMLYHSCSVGIKRKYASEKYANFNVFYNVNEFYVLKFYECFLFVFSVIPCRM